MMDDLRRMQTQIDVTNASDLRGAFGRFATGVTIVTARADWGHVGMTVNSFTSVSLDPPLVMWCPAVKSARHDAFAQAKTFAIHVLAADQADMAKQFAKTGDGFEEFGAIPCDQGMMDLPGALTRFTCTQEAVYPGGDHSIIIGRIQSATTRNGAALGYARGNFVTIDEMG